MDQKQNREKLLAHLRYIQEHEPESFDLGVWGNNLDKAKAAEKHFAESGTVNCGFAGCVVGHLPFVFQNIFYYNAPSGVMEVATIEDGIEVEEAYLAKFLGGETDDWRNIIYEDEYEDEYGDVLPVVSIDLVIDRIQDLHDNL